MNLENYKKWWAENKHHIHRLMLFAIGAILLFIGVLLLTPCLNCIRSGGIPLTWMQLVYGLLSVLIAVALYVWGVGNWSRFEPPSDTPTPRPDAAQGVPVAPQPAAPASPKGGD